MNAKLDKALEALQLCLKLLPQSSREELRRLLTFMCLAADPQGLKVDKEVRAAAEFNLIQRSVACSQYSVAFEGGQPTGSEEVVFQGAAVQQDALKGKRGSSVGFYAEQH